MKKKKNLTRPVAMAMAVSLAFGSIPYNVMANETFQIAEEKISEAVGQGNPGAQKPADALSSATYYTKPNWEARIKDKSRWKVEDSQTLVRVTTSDPVRMNDIDYDGMYINANGRYVIRLIYKERTLSPSAVWHKALINFGELDQYIDFSNSYVFGRDGKTRYTFDPVKGVKGRGFDVASASGDRTNGRKNLPINLVLKDGITLKNLPTKNYIIQMRLCDDDYKRVYAYAPGKSSMDYSTYTKTTSVSLLDNLNNLFIKGGYQEDSNNATSQEFFMSEFIANPDRYKDVSNLGIIRTQYMGQTSTIIRENVGGEPIAFTQVFDSNLLNYLKADDDKNVGYVKLLTVAREESPYAQEVGIKLTDFNKITVEGGHELAYLVFAIPNYKNLVASKNPEVKVVEIPKNDQHTMLSGNYITGIDYVVDKKKFEDTFSSNYTRKLDYSTMSGWTNPNKDGWLVYERKFDNDYVVQEGDSFMVDAGAGAKGKQIMIQVGGEQAILRRPQGYYNGYATGKSALDKFDEIADGVFQFTIGEGTTVKSGKSLKIYMPYTSSFKGDEKINFLQIHNGTKLNEGAATLTLQKDRNINMHLYKQGKKGYFVLKYTLKDETEVKSLKFTPNVFWTYKDNDKVLTGASNTTTGVTGGNFYINTKKLKPGTDIIVESYDNKDNKIESETSLFKYIPLDKSQETVKLLTWTDHSDKRSVLSINKSLYTPYQVLFTNDYAEGTDDFYKDPRVLPADNAKFNTDTTQIVGYTKYDSGKVRTLYEGDKLLFGKVEADGNEYDKDGNLVGQDVRKEITIAKKDIFDAQFAEDSKKYKAYEYTFNLKKMLPYHSDDKTETKLTLLKDMKFVSTASDGSSLPSDLIETRVRARVLFDATDGKWSDNTTKAVKIVPDNVKFYGEEGYKANGFEGEGADTNTGDKFPEAPKLQGKNFLGWVTEKGKEALNNQTTVTTAKFNALSKDQVFTNTTPVEKHLVVYAIYSEETVVTLDANGGVFKDGEGQITKKPEELAGIESPTKDGFTFKGWADTKDATEANVTDPSKLTESKTVYAVWEQVADKKLNLNPPTELVPVSDKTDLTTNEKEAVKQAVIDANPTLNLTKDDITVGSDGKVTVKTTDGKTGELTPEQTVKQKEVINNINPPAPPVEVKNPDALDDTEKGKVKDAIIKANPDLNLKPEEVTVDDNGKVTINQGGKTGTVPADKTVVEESKIIKLNKPTPVEVKDVNNLTPAEKEAVKDAVVAANSGLSRDKISVDGNGNVTVTDGDKTGKLEGKDTVKPFDRTGKTLNDPKEKVEVSDKNNLTKAEKEAVREAVKAANPDLNFKDEEIQVDDNGKVTVPMGTDGSGNTIYKEIAPEKTVKKDDTTKTISLKAPKVTVVGDPTSLTDDEKAAVKQAVLDANNTSGLTLNDITVANDGSVTVTKGNKTGMLAQADTVVKKLDSPKIASDEDGKVVVGPKDERTSEIEVTYKDTNDAEQKVTAKKDPTTGEWKLDPKVDGVKINKDSGLISIPASKIKNGTEVKAVAKDGANTSEENTIKSEDKQAPARPELKENEDGSVTITPPKDADTATVTIKYGDKEVIATKDGNNWTFNPADSGLNVDQGGNIVIPADKLSPGTKVSAQAEDANGNKSSEPEIITKTQAEKIDPVVPAKTPVADPTNLTKEEKDTVKKAIEDANKDKFPQGTTVEVDETGKATIKYPDGSTDTIPAVSLVEKVDKTELQEEADKNKNDAIKNSDKYKNADQTKKDAYDTALDKANTVLNDPNAKQKDVDEALKQLKEAEAALDGQATPAEKTTSPTITKPNAGDKEIKGTAPAGSDVTVTLPDGTEIKTKADQDGKWTAKLPEGKEIAENDEIKVVAKDGDKEPSTEVKETAGPKASEEKTTAPTITKPNAGDKEIKGTAPAGSDVTVTLPDGTEIKTKADQDGKWTAKLPEGKEIAENDEIKVVAKDGDKEPSTEVKETAGPKASEEKTTAPDVKVKNNGDITVTPPADATKVTISYTDPYGNLVSVDITKGTDNNWNIPAGSVLTKDSDGNIVIPANNVKPGTEVTATAEYPGGTKATGRVNTDSNPQYPIYPGHDGYNGLPLWYFYGNIGSNNTKVEPKKEVKEVKEKGHHEVYMYGYPDGTFRPNANITRAEAAAMISRLKGYSLNDKTAPEFKDSKVGWFKAAINAVFKNGLMKGYEDGNFRPDDKITRAEFAQMIKNIDKSNSAVATFKDVKGHWAEDAINQAFGNGRISGYPDGTFRPDAPITRAEAVKIANSLFERSVDNSGLKEKLENPTMISKFTDVNNTHWAFYEIMEATNSHEFERRENGKVAEDWLEIDKDKKH